MSDTVTAIALLILLAAPGPTNALLLAFGATRPPCQAINALAAELAGYMLALVALSAGLLPLVQGQPLILTGLKLLAIGCLVLTAVRLWRQSRASAMQSRSGGADAVFFISLTNPKGLIIALMLWPAGGLPSMASLAGTAGAILVSGSLWLALGHLTSRLAAGRLADGHGLLCRGCALLIAAFAGLMLASLVPTA